MFSSLIVPLVAFGASILTFFSGFGLGTILTPAFALFFPIDIAIALTALVHFLNNLFKITLVGRTTHWPTVVRFGIPALLASYVGAKALVLLSTVSPFYTYVAAGREFHILPIKLVIAAVMMVFTLIEIIPKYKSLAINAKLLPLGGILSGFFGGISGHQGALRSMFLVKLRLSKEAFIGTGVAIACMIDLTRLSVYSEHFLRKELLAHTQLLVVTALAAFAGAYLGSRMLKKLTLNKIQNIVTVMVLVIAIGLALGLV